MKSPVVVVGGGFSGLTVAYFLTKQGIKVDLYEKGRLGGLIGSIFTPHGLIETAANGLINSELVESLAADLALPMIKTKKSARKRYIFRKTPRRWPLNPLETTLFFGKLLKSSAGFSKNMKPLPMESIRQWGHRCLGVAPSEQLLIPALQGIYAGDPDRLSASLILQRLFDRSSKKKLSDKGSPKAYRGTVAPKNGMGQLVEALRKYLESQGTKFILNKAYSSEDWIRAGKPPLVLSTNGRDAADFLKDVDADISSKLLQVEMLPLVSVTVFSDPEARRLQGFGCLFPRTEPCRALGVLLNHEIFENRSDVHSETWIYGGASDLDMVNLSDSEIEKIVLKDQELLHKSSIEPLHMRIQKWPQAIPHYTVKLEETLEKLPLTIQSIHLHGNYLGGIGLSKILERSQALANHIFRTKLSEHVELAPRLAEGEI